jgi:O-antigen/teichoic acid export membrane protein
MPRDEHERQSSDGRHESELERLDRNQIELLNELRVAGTGIQVLLAFLLVLPFQQRFTKLDGFERGDFYVTLVLVAVSAVLLIGPSIHHRLLFRRAEKRFLVETGSRFLIAAMLCLAPALAGMLILISDVLFGGVAAAVAGALMLALVASLWFAVPLRRRSREGVSRLDAPGNRKSGTAERR